MNFLYLLVDLAAISVPLIFSFHKSTDFRTAIKPAFLAIITVAVPFLIWDIIFTRDGVWGFNPRYLTGLYFFELPIEEVLFFICIPYSCLFTYFVLKGRISFTISRKAVILSSSLIGMLLLTVAVMNYGKLYTFWSVGLCGLVVLVSPFIFGKNLVQFVISYIILLIPFFIVNGILTGTGIEEQVVWYNDAENSGLRILTIPVEDFSFGYLMLILNTMVFERFYTRFTKSSLT